MKKIILLCASLMLSINVFSQDAEKKLGSWYQLASSHELTDRVNLETLFTQVNYEAFDAYHLDILRVAANYQFTPNFNVSLGYADFEIDRTYNVEDAISSHSRIYQDFKFNHKIRVVSFTHRLRTEQMFTKPKIKHFIRYCPLVKIPVHNKIAAYAYDEIFFNEKAAYVQNWVGAGLSYKFNKIFSLSVGGLGIFSKQAFLKKFQIGLSITTK